FLRVLALGESGEPYNIGNPTPEISMLQLCEKLTTILKRPVKFDLRPYPDSYPGDEPMRRCPDISKARRGVGYEPTVSLDDGLTRFFRWAFDTYTKI
ncbi:MAG TPA: nucleoside-diphosphate sugar epimerase, partial [Oligoflexia bacterium]|nr:nucleoside-diphosphate sugar epimerase [Oligoflexia bacterium]